MLRLTHHRKTWVLIGMLALAASAVTAAEDGEVRLYTNADLEALEPLTLERQPQVERPAESWEFVNEFIDRSHARIDAQRDHDLARAALETIPGERRRGRVGFLPLQGFYHQRFPLFRGERSTRARTDGGGMRTPAIRPIHAGPSKAMRMRSQATRRDGRDAFPR